MPNCKVIIKPLVQGIDLPNTTMSGSTITSQQVGCVAIDSAVATYGLGGQTQTVKYNTPITLKATLVDAENYTFLGWKSENTGTILETKYNFTFNAQDSDVYYAVFARKSYSIGIKSSSANMGSVKFVGYTVKDVAQNISTNETTALTTHQVEQGGKVTIQAIPKKNNDTNREYVFAQWDDGNKENPRVVNVSEAKTYTAQFREPDPSPDATGILFIGVQKLKPSALNYAGTEADPVPKKVILIDKESGVMPDAAGNFAIAGLPANSARLTILTSTKEVSRGSSTNTLGKPETYYNTIDVADMADSATKHSSTTSTASGAMSIRYKGETSGTLYQNYDASNANSGSRPSGGFGYYVVIDLKDETGVWTSDNLYKGNEFDTCPGGWIGYSNTCGYWHYWCNNGGIQGAGPYNGYSYTKSVTFSAWEKDEDGKATDVSNISVKVNNIRLENENSVKSADLTIDIKADDGVTYRLANVIFTGAEENGVAEGARINFANGDKVVDFNLNGVAFSHALPEAIIANGGENSTDRTEYATIREALEKAENGDVVYVYGPAISEIIGTGVEVAEGVRIISYDGTEINLNSGNAKINADSDGTLNLVGGTLTVVPPTDDEGNREDTTVGVGQGKVSTDETIIVSTQNGGEVTTTTETQEVVISPDGDPNHTVIFKGCESDKTYGMNTGNYTTETEVEIGAGTEYDLVIDNGTSEDGSDNNTIIKTDSTNTGSTIVKKETTENGTTQTVITTEKENDSVEIGGNTFSATEDNTKITVSPDKETPVLTDGGVVLSPESGIELPNGNVVKNTGTTIGGNASIEVESDGSVTVPNGGKVEVEAPNGEVFEVKVPNNTLNPDGTINEDATPNMPSKITMGTNGTPVVETPSGSSVVIGDPTNPDNYFEVGEYDAKFEMNEDGDVQVTDGTVVLKPGQSITDSNGTTFTNNGSEPLNITTNEDGNTQVDVPSDGSFQYTPAGSNTPLVYDNPGNSDASFNVDSNGQVSLDSEMTMSNASNVNVSLNGVVTNIKTPSTNQGQVKIDPVEGSVLVEKAGDKVTIGNTEYTAKEDGTTLIPEGNKGVALEKGTVGLDKNESIIVSGTTIQNTGNGSCDVEANPENSTSTVKVPEGGSFAMSEPGGSNKVVISNNSGAEKQYEVNMDGGIGLSADEELSFTQNGKTTNVVAGDSGAEIKPTEEGVLITVPKNGTVTIDGKVYANQDNNKELVIMVDKNGNHVLVSGSIEMSQDASIKLADGTSITNNGSAMSLDAHGNMMIPNEGSVSIAPPGKQSTTYEAQNGQLALSYDPEKQIPTIVDGCTEIGKNASVAVTFNISTTEKEVDENGQYTGETSVYEREQNVIITGTGNTPVTVDKTNGTITVPKDGAIKVEAEKINDDGTVTVATNTISVPSGASNDSVLVTPKNDGSVDVELGAAEDAKVTVNNVEYEATAENTKINVAENGSTLIAGAVNLDGGKNPKEGIIANGNLITNLGGAGKDVAVEILNNGNTAFEVSAGGQFSMEVPGVSSSKVVFTNPSTTETSGYEIAPNGTIALGENSSISFETSNGNVVVEGGEGVSIQITEEGVAIKATGTNPVTIGGVTYQPTGAGVTIIIDKQGRPIITEGEAEVPFNSSVYIKDEEGKLTEIKKTGYVEDDTNPNASKVTISADGKVTGLAGDTIKIGSGTYKSLDTAGTFEMEVDPQNKDVKVTSGSNLEVTNGNATLGGVTVGTVSSLPVQIEIPSGSSKPTFTVKPGGSATVKEENAEEVLEIKVPSGVTEDKTVVMDNSGNLTVSMDENEKITIGGIIYTAQQEGEITVNGKTGQLISSTITPNGLAPTVSVDPDNFNQPNYTYNVPAGTSVQVGDTTYTAPEGSDMVISGNPNGNPIISVEQAGSTVTIGENTYTTAEDNTKFVVNSPNNVTLVDNGNPNANSALKVEGSKTMVIDGNTITSSGNDNAGYVVQKMPNGEKLTIEDGTKVSVSVGNAGTDIIINDNVTYGATTVSKPVKITANSVGNGFVIDKSVENADGNYDVTLTPGTSTNLTPIVDDNGVVIGFKAATKPVPPPFVPSTDQSDEKEEASDAKEFYPEDSHNDIEEETQDAENEEKTDEEDVNQDDLEDEEILAKETVKVAVDTVDEIKDVNISGKAEVTVGQGAIIIESGDKGQVAAITGDLQTIIEAILTKDDMEAVQNGSTVVIRLNVMPIEENKTVDSSMDDNQKELQEIKKVFPKYQKEIEGLTLVEGYDILVEKSIDGSKWQTVSELNDEVEITMLIPKELRKEGRTFFMLHNHEGEISILEDLDVDIDTITIKTVKFSAYVISYTDANVDDISVEKVNEAINGGSLMCVISSLILIIVLLSIAGYMIYKKKKNRNK